MPSKTGNLVQKLLLVASLFAGPVLFGSFHGMYLSCARTPIMMVFFWLVILSAVFLCAMFCVDLAYLAVGIWKHRALRSGVPMLLLLGGVVGSTLLMRPVTDVGEKAVFNAEFPRYIAAVKFLDAEGSGLGSEPTRVDLPSECSGLAALVWAWRDESGGTCVEFTRNGWLDHGYGFFYASEPRGCEVGADLGRGWRISKVMRPQWYRWNWISLGEKEKQSSR